MIRPDKRDRHRAVLGCLTVVAALFLPLLTGCANIRYFSQAVSGHFRIMHSRVPIESALQTDRLSVQEKNQLKLVSEVRAYASEKLDLPKNESYTVYAEIKEEYPGWNVFAAPRFSIEPIKWCFPVAGCVVYRGFFSKKEALEFKKKTEEKDLDVLVLPFNAYSTLGWFDDPVLSSQLGLNPIRLAGLIIHELAHQRFYLSGDSRFSEGFAVTVERVGVMRWLKSTGRNDLVPQAVELWRQEDLMVSEILKTRDRLRDLYSSGLDPESLIQEKTSIFRDLKTDLSQARVDLPKTNGEEIELNNALMVPVDTYYSLVPVFQSILNSYGGSLPQFFRKVEELAKLPPEKRQQALDAIELQAMSHPGR